MSTFDDLFGDMGEAYAAIVRAHLEIKAQAGNPDAAHLLDADGPQPGDVVWAKDTTWTWDSADGLVWSWWSAKLRASETLQDYQPIIWQGQPADAAMPAAAVELFNAVDWMLATGTLCSQDINPRTNARFYKPLGIDSVSELVDAYRTPASPGVIDKEDEPQ